MTAPIDRARLRRLLEEAAPGPCEADAPEPEPCTCSLDAALGAKGFV